MGETILAATFWAVLGSEPTSRGLLLSDGRAFRTGPGPGLQKVLLFIQWINKHFLLFPGELSPE